MNRRGFIAAIIAAPLAGLEGLRPTRRLTFANIWKMIDRFRRPAMTTTKWAETVGGVDYWSAGDPVSINSEGKLTKMTEGTVDFLGIVGQDGS